MLFEEKVKLINQGLFLDEFKNDDNPYVRLEVLNYLERKELNSNELSIVKELLNDEKWIVREKIADSFNGYKHDILYKDKHPHVRAAVAREGNYLQELIDDGHWIVRLEVAKQGFGHDFLVNDEDWSVRREVAIAGNHLQKLLNDEHWIVRLEIASQGLFLDTLKNDKNKIVSRTAKNLINSKIYIVERKFGTYKGHLKLTIKNGKYKIESGCYKTESLDKWNKKCKKQLDLETANKYTKIIKDLIDTAN